MRCCVAVLIRIVSVRIAKNEYHLIVIKLLIKTTPTLIQMAPINMWWSFAGLFVRFSGPTINIMISLSKHTVMLSQ